MARRHIRSGELPLAVAGDPWLYKVARLILVPVVRLYGRVEIGGAELLPASGPALIVADHPSDLDPLILGVALPRTLHFMASPDHFDPGFVGWCVRRLAAVSVDREGDPAGVLEPALDLLRLGHVVAVFPDRDLREARTLPFEAGVAFLAQTSGVPVLPVALHATDELLRGRWRRGLPWSWRSRPLVRMTVGRPLFIGPGDRRSAATHIGEAIAGLHADRADGRGAATPATPIPLA